MSSASLIVKRVETSREWKEFYNLPFQIYRGDPYWVPPLLSTVKDLLDVNANPFFRHAVMCPLIALREGKVVGRVVGVIDEVHNRFHEEKKAFFGFFESIDDSGVARALLDQVKTWAKEWGMDEIRGPCNPSTNHECGLLVEGFEDPPQIMMAYNPRYYERLLQENGFQKTKDLHAFEIRHDSQFDERLVRHNERLRQKSQITFRPVNLKKMDDEINLMAEIYNDAWEKNWGFVPMNFEEFRHSAKDLKMICDPEIILIGYVRGEPAGFSIALPDFNQVLKRIPSGKLFPTGLIKILWYLHGPFRRKVINRGRIVTLGVRRKFMNAGLGALFYQENFNRMPKQGYYTGEASWILEDNIPMQKAAKLMGGRLIKVYRLYDASLA